MLIDPPNYRELNSEKWGEERGSLGFERWEDITECKRDGGGVGGEVVFICGSPLTPLTWSRVSWGFWSSGKRRGTEEGEDVQTVSFSTPEGRRLKENLCSLDSAPDAFLCVFVWVFGYPCASQPVCVHASLSVKVWLLRWGGDHRASFLNCH